MTKFWFESIRQAAALASDTVDSVATLSTLESVSTLSRAFRGRRQTAPAVPSRPAPSDHNNKTCSSFKSNRGPKAADEPFDEGADAPATGSFVPQEGEDLALA